MEIWLIRHGTTTANEEARIQGRLDYPLSARGRREAALLAHRLGRLGLELLLSSDLRRAWETALIIAKETGLEPVRAAPLRECSWGAIEGMTLDDIRSRYPFLVRDARGGLGLKAPLFGGERQRKLQARAGKLLKYIAFQYPSCRRIALVSHGRFINALIASALEFKARQRWPFAPHPASLSMLKFDPERDHYRLELFNDCCHLF
jgi:2,3-bisphosphoglycerate-dependent phosphoglycerate mutase